MGSSNGGTDELKRMVEPRQSLKEGERIVAPSRRPDGTYRKPIRIRPGYVPQEEVPIYQSKGALWKKEMASQVGPPGYFPDTESKPKTKAAKRNERKKEKKQLAALEKGKSSEGKSGENTNEEVVAVEDLACQMVELAVSSNDSGGDTASKSSEGADAGSCVQDIDKRIRALKKKLRLAEGVLQKTAMEDMKAEQREKLSKMEDWRQELRVLEEKKAQVAML